jgi:predicted nucleotidyltransferase
MNSKMIERMVGCIAENFQPEQVILFGSHARGEADADSDVDFLVVRENGGSEEEDALAIRRRLREFPVACDVLVKSRRDYERLRKVVNHIVYFADRYGKVVYER